MATVRCRVQYLDDTDPFSSTNFPEPSRPPFFEFNEYAPLIEQIGMVHKLLNAPHQIDDCTLQLSHTGAYLDLESSLEEQRDELEGFNRERKHSMILRTQLAVRVHGCIEKLLSSSGRELRRALFSLKQIFQDDKDLVHEFVSADGLACLIKVGAEADQNYQNYILRALGQVMLYVDGMNGVIEHNETIQWLYSLIASKFRLVVKTSLKLLLVFVEYTESNTQLLIQAINIVDRKHGHPPWHNLMLLLKDEGQDSEILAYAMTLVNKALNAIPDQDTFYDVTDALEEQGIDRVQQKYVKMRGGDPDVKEQFQIYEASLKHADGDIDIPVERQKDLRQRQRVTPESSDGEKRKSKRSAMKVSEPYRVQNTVRNLSSGLRVMDDEPVQSAQRRRRRQRSRASSSDLESSIAIQATVETPVTEKPVEQSPSSVEERKTTTPSPLESYRQRRERLLAAKNRLSYEDSSSDVNGSIESHSTHHTPVANTADTVCYRNRIKTTELPTTAKLSANSETDSAQVSESVSRTGELEATLSKKSNIMYDKIVETTIEEHLDDIHSTDGLSKDLNSTVQSTEDLLSSNAQSMSFPAMDIEIVESESVSYCETETSDEKMIPEKDSESVSCCEPEKQKEEDESQPSSVQREDQSLSVETDDQPTSLQKGDQPACLETHDQRGSLQTDDQLVSLQGDDDLPKTAEKFLPDDGIVKVDEIAKESEMSISMDIMNSESAVGETGCVDTLMKECPELETETVSISEETQLSVMDDRNIIDGNIIDGKRDSVVTEEKSTNEAMDNLMTSSTATDVIDGMVVEKEDGGSADDSHNTNNAVTETEKPELQQEETVDTQDMDVKCDVVSECVTSTADTTDVDVNEVVVAVSEIKVDDNTGVSDTDEHQDISLLCNDLADNVPMTAGLHSYSNNEHTQVSSDSDDLDDMLVPRWMYTEHEYDTDKGSAKCETISTSIVEETFDQNADTDVVFTATLPSSPSPNHSEEYNSFSSSRNNDKAENEDTDIMTLLTCGDSDTSFTYTVDSSASTQRSQFVQDDEIAGHFNTDDKGYHVPTLHNNALEQREKDKEDSHSTVTLDKEVLNHENTEPQLTLDNRRNDRHMRESLSGMDAKDISVINRSKELLPSISIEDEVFVEQHTNKDATSSDANRLRLNFVSQRTVTLSSSGSSPSTPTSQQELLFPSAANTSKECTAPDVSLRSEEKTRTFNTDQKTFSAKVQSTEKEEDHSSVDKLTSQKQQFEAEEDSDVMKLLSTGFGSVSDVKTKNVPETTSQDQSLSSTSLGAENSDFDTVVTLKWGDNTSEHPSYSEYNRQPSNEKHETPRASRSSLRGVRLQSSRSQSSVEDCTELFSEKSHIPLEPSAETNVDISEQVNLCTAGTSSVKYATEILEGSREEDHDISTIDKTKTLRLAVGENDTSVSKEEDVIVVEPAEILYESVSVCVTEKPKLNQALVHENKKKVRCMSLSEEEFIEDEFSKEDIDSFEIEKIKIGSLSEIGDEWNAIHVNTEIVFQEPIVTVSPKVELKAAGCTELEIFTAAIKEQERISEGEYIEESDDNQKSQMTKDTLMEIVDENSSEDVESSQRYRPSSRKWQEEEDEEEDIMSFLSRGYSARRSRRTVDDDEDDVLKMLSQGVTEPTVEDDIPQVYVEEDKFMAHDVQDSEEAVDEPVVEFKVVIDEQKQSREDSVKHESQEEVSHDKEDEYLSIRERRRRRRAAEIVSAEIQNVDIEEQTEDTDTDEGTTSVSLEYYESGDTDTSFLETDSEAAFADDEEDDVMAFLSGGFSASRRRRQYFSASESDHDDDVMKLLSVGDSDSEVTVTLPAARPQEVSSFEDSHDEIHVQIPYKERVQEVAVPEARVDEREDEEDTLKGSSDDDSDTTLEMEEYLNDYEREYEIEELPPEEAFIRPLKLALMEDREEGYDENDEVAESVSDNVDIVVDRRLDTIPEVEEVEDDDVRRWQSESDTAYGSAPESEGSSPDDDEDIRLHRETDEKILERKAVSYKVKEPEKGEEEEDDVMQFLSRGFTGGRSYGRMAKTAVEEESEDDIMKLLCQGFAESVPEEPVSKAPKESQEDVKLERIDARSLHEEKEEDEFALRKTVESESSELSDSSEESEEDELEELEKLEIIEESDISDVTAEDVDVDDGESETSYYSRSRGSKWADEDEYVPRLSRRSRYSDHSYEEYDNEDDIMALLSGGDSSLSESMTSVTDLSGTEFDERYTSEEEPEVIICRARELELMEERYYVPNILEEYDLYSESEKAEITLHVAEEICDKRIFAFGVGITEMICEDFEGELKEEVFMDKERCATETFINACELQQRDNVTEVVLWQSEEIPIGYTASIDDVEEFLMEDQAEEIVVDVRDAALEALAGISLSESGWKEVSSKIEETAELLKQMVDRGASVPSDTFQLVKSDDATAASIKDLLSHLSAFNSFFLPAALMASVTAYALGIFMPAFSAGLYIGNCLRPSSKTGTRKGPVVPVISTSPTVEEPSSGSSVYPIHKIVLPDTAAVDLDKNEDLDFLQLIEPGDSDVFDKDDKFVTVPAGALAATIKHYKQHRSEGDERDYRPSYLKQKPADLTADVGSDFVQVQKDYYNMLSDTYVLASLSHAGSDRSKQKSDSASQDRETSPRQKSTTSDIQEREHKSPKPKKESENSTEAELPMGPIWPKQKPEDGDTPDRRSTKRLVATNSFTDLLLSGESDSLVSDSEYGTDPFTDEASDHGHWVRRVSSSPKQTSHTEDYYSKNRSQDRDNKSEPSSTRRKRSKHGRSRRKHSRSAEGTLSHQRRKSRKSDNVSPERQISLCPQPPSSPSPQQHQSLPKSYNWVDEYSLSDSSDSDVSPETIEPMEFDQEDETDLMALLSRGDSLKPRQEPRDENYISYHARMKQQRQSSGRYAERKTDEPSTKTEQREGRRSRQYRRKDMSPVVTDDDPDTVTVKLRRVRRRSLEGMSPERDGSMIQSKGDANNERKRSSRTESADHKGSPTDYNANIADDIETHEVLSDNDIADFYPEDVQFEEDQSQMMSERRPRVRSQAKDESLVKNKGALQNLWSPATPSSQYPEDWPEDSFDMQLQLQQKQQQQLLEENKLLKQKMKALTSAQKDHLQLVPKQLLQLSPEEQLQLVPKDLLQSFSKEELELLTTGQLQLVPKEMLKSVSVEQLESLTEEEMELVPREMLESISKDTLKSEPQKVEESAPKSGVHIPTDLINQLPPQIIAKLPPQIKNKIAPEVLAQLPPPEILDQLPSTADIVHEHIHLHSQPHVPQVKGQVDYNSIQYQKPLPPTPDSIPVKYVSNERSAKYYSPLPPTPPSSRQHAPLPATPDVSATESDTSEQMPRPFYQPSAMFADTQAIPFSPHPSVQSEVPSAVFADTQGIPFSPHPSVQSEVPSAVFADTKGVPFSPHPSMQSGVPSESTMPATVQPQVPTNTCEIMPEIIVVNQPNRKLLRPSTGVESTTSEDDKPSNQQTPVLPRNLPLLPNTPALLLQDPELMQLPRPTLETLLYLYKEYLKEEEPPGSEELNVSKSRFRNRFEEVPSEKEMRNEGLKERDSCSLSSSSSSGSSLRDEDRKSPSPSCISSTSTASNESTEGSSSSAFTKGVPPPSSTVDPRRRPIMNSDFGAQLEKPELERIEQERSERIGDSSQDQVLSNNKRLFLAMMGSKMKSVDDEEDLPKEARPLPTRRISQCLSATESLGDRIENLQSSTGEVTRTVQDNIDNAGAVMNAQERLSQSTVDESGDKGPLGPTGDRTGVIGQAIEGLQSVGKSPTCSDSEQHKAAAPPKREVDERWDQLLASTNRALKIKDLDFTDLAASDDEDVLEPKVTAVDSATVGGIPPPPPPPPLGGPPPPPPAPPAPPHLFGVPPPPPLFGMTALDGKVPGKPSDGTLKKSKKTLKLFWKEVRNNSPFMSQKSPVKTTIWNTLDPVELDTTKLEHLFESRTKELSFKKMEEATQKKEVTVLDAKRSNAINIGMTVLPSIRTIKPAILNMDSVAMNREAIEKILTMMPTDEEKSKIKDASLANPDLPLGTAEQFLITLGSISELNARLNLWMFKLDYDSMEQEVAEPLMDLKKGMEDLKENKTFRRILSMLLAIGNFLNDAQHKGFQLDYLAKVPEVKDTVRKQSLLYHLCIMMMEKFPESSDLYSEIGPITRCSKVEFDQISENLTTMEKRCKESWEHLKAIAKHDSHSELRFRLQSFLGDCAERIIVLKTVHRRVINRFHKLLLYMGMTPQAIKEVKIGQFCRIISEFALEYRTVRERALDVQKKKANQRERNKTRGKLISDTKNFSKVQDKDDHDKLKKLLKNTGTAPGDEHLGRSRSRAQGHYAGTPDDDDAPDEMMELLVKSATAPSNRHTPRERKRARQSNRKSLRRTLKSGLTPEEKQALGMGSRTEVRV